MPLSSLTCATVLLNKVHYHGPWPCQNSTGTCCPFSLWPSYALMTLEGKEFTSLAFVGLGAPLQGCLGTGKIRA